MGAIANYNKPEVLAEISKGIGDAMPGMEISQLEEDQRLQDRGW